MKRRLTLLLASAGLVFCLTGLAVAPAAAYNPFGDSCSSAAAKGSPACSTTGADPLTGSNGIVTKAVNVLSIVTGIASVVVIIVAGFGFINSGGDSTKTAGARRAIIGAVVGLLIVLLAQTIIVFVLNKIH